MTPSTVVYQKKVSSTVSVIASLGALEYEFTSDVPISAKLYSLKPPKKRENTLSAITESVISYL